MVQLIKLLHTIYELIHNFYYLLATVWFAVHGVLRFIGRMIAAIPIFFGTIPAWIIAVGALSLFMGFGLFLLGRK